MGATSTKKAKAGRRKKTAARRTQARARPAASAADGLPEVVRHPDPGALEYISADLRTLAVPIHLVTADPGNLRAHDERNLRATMSSLRAYGQRKPIVCNVVPGEDGKPRLVTEAGAGTLEAARRLGWHYIAISREQDDDETARNYAVADNRTGELSTWKDHDLAAHLRQQDVLTREALGFGDRDLSKLLKKIEGASPRASADDPSPQLGATKYRVVVEKLNGEPLTEAQQVDVLKRLQAEGYTCTAPIS